MLAHILMSLGIYVGTYGAVHLYLFRKLFQAFPALRRFRRTAVLLSVFLMVIPFAVLAAQGTGPHLLLRVLHAIGFFWMGFLFFFLCFGLLGEVVTLVVAVTRLIATRRLPHPPLPVRPVVLVVLTASLLLSAYAAVEAAWPRVEHVTLKTSRLPPGVNRLRVVQISDLHLGAAIHGSRLDQILRTIGDQEPDLIVATGDLLDSRMGIAPRHAEALRSLRPPRGKFACMGNHETYVGLDESRRFFRSSGFRTLEDEGLSVGDGVIVVGVSDPGHDIAAHARSGNEGFLLAPLRRDGAFLLLLKHRPEVAPGSIGLFDLQLSGHVHGGQIFPFNWLTRMVYPARMGLSDVGRGSSLYVSRGIGTWGPPMRFLAPPEITVIDLVHAP
jgi:hypothetical protein